MKTSHGSINSSFDKSLLNGGGNNENTSFSSYFGHNTSLNTSNSTNIN